MKSSVRNLIVYPLLVGAVVAVFAFLLPILFQDEKRLSYTIDGPLPYVMLSINSGGKEEIKVVVEGEELSNPTGYAVRLWNSGDVPISNLPVQLVFDDDKDAFRIVYVGHTTKPVEFSVKEEEIDAFSARFTYEFLNPGDEDLVNVLTDQDPNLQVIVRAEGLSVEREDAPMAEVRDLWVFPAILSALGALLAMVLRLLQDIKTTSEIRKSVQPLKTRSKTE